MFQISKLYDLARKENEKSSTEKKFITASSSFILAHQKILLLLQDKNVHDEAHKLMKKFSSPKDTTKAWYHERISAFRHEEDIKRGENFFSYQKNIK